MTNDFYLSALYVRAELEHLKRWAGDQNRLDPTADAWASQVEMWCESKLSWLDQQAQDLEEQRERHFPIPQQEQKP